MHSSSRAQMAHAVWFLSVQPVSALHTSMPQLVGQALSVWPGLLTHSPSFAHPGQSSCVSLHAGLHTPHETGQCMFMNPGLSEHSPSLDQWLQSAVRSTHLGAQRPQEVGHSLCMFSGAFVLSPSLAQSA